MQSIAEQSRAKQSKAKQSKAKQSKAKQSKEEQSKAKQSIAEQRELKLNKSPQKTKHNAVMVSKITNIRNYIKLFMSTKITLNQKSSKFAQIFVEQLNVFQQESFNAICLHTIKRSHAKVPSSQSQHFNRRPPIKLHLQNGV